MEEVKWIKVVTDIFDDEKVKFIENMPNGDKILVIWFKILCLAGKSNSKGLLMMTDRIPYSEDMLASVFNKNIKTVQLAIKTFIDLGMLESIEGKIYILNWEKHQNIEKLERIREQTKTRVANHRAKHLSSIACNDTVTDNVTLCNATELELEQELELEEDLKKNTKALYDTFSEFLKLVESEFKRPLSSSEIQKLQYWENEVGVEYMYHSLREAVIFHASTIGYLDKVLVAWRAKGYTLEQLNAGMHRERR